LQKGTYKKNCEQKKGQFNKDQNKEGENQTNTHWQYEQQQQQALNCLEKIQQKSCPKNSKKFATFFVEFSLNNLPKPSSHSSIASPSTITMLFANQLLIHATNVTQIHKKLDDNCKLDSLIRITTIT
jgi:hypothetical protein